MSITLAADPDDVAIRVGDTDFKGWQTVAIALSCETMPNSFQLTASTEYMQGPALAGTRPGQACQIRIGSDLVITGWIDRRAVTADGRSHQVTLSGRGITRNLLDCAADLLDPSLAGGSISAPNTLNLAQRLCDAYKINARSAVSDLGVEIPNFSIRLGETPYQIIESAARYAGFLVYEDAYGSLVLDRVGGNAMAAGPNGAATFAMPGNIEAIAAERSVDQRYSDYYVVFYSVDQFLNFNSLANQRAHVTDTNLGEHRVWITVSAQNSLSYDVAVVNANWEANRRYGRSQAAQITCDSWRDSSGKLWTPNWLATIEAQDADISGANWIIGSVTLRKDMSGTHADLVLMPPEAFSPEPNPLNLFAAEFANAPRVSQNPAPPSTGATLGEPPT